MALKIDLPNLAEFVKGFEGFSPRAFWDHKQYSYGYGNKAPSATATISKIDAHELLTVRLAKDSNVIVKALKVPANSNVISALTSFAFNTGLGTALAMVADLNAGKTLQAVANRMKLYKYSSGVINNGLITRRTSETKKLLS